MAVLGARNYTFTEAERLALLIEREKLYRANRRLGTPLKKAQLKHDACFDDRRSN
ncbi:hypothetical protein [Desulfonatronum lacustre]|uniref:hypothetical protein n=1 Tax=Desulfonatronum lacustre TaxID=66849 RepID=UPI0004AD1B88|nr:hypothetical protein [Desulfonatronum lacustre]